MKNYTLKPAGRSEIAGHLSRWCAFGKFGAPLIESGFSQSLFATCLAKWIKAVAANLTPAEFATALENLSACNASAARQALEACEIDLGETTDEEWAAAGGSWVYGGKTHREIPPAKEAKEAKRVTPLTVKDWWKTVGPVTATVDTSKLGY